MKKFIKYCLVLVLCVCTCLTFVGCGSTKWSKTTNDMSNVVSNGGITLRHKNWIYFVNGTKENTVANNSKSNIRAGIYRVKTDDDGNILYKENTTSTVAEEKDEDNKEVKEFLQVEPVVKSIVGFDDGSIFIFGDYLYFTTPCTAKNKDGDMLTGKTSFKRYDLESKQIQTLYTTSASDDTINFTYYRSGSSLNLVVYEKTSATLKSFLIGNDVKLNFKKTDVTSALMSDNFGNVENAAVSLADQYIYYTLSYDNNSALKKGVRVYKILPNGEGLTKISEGEDVALLTVRAGRLVYSKDSIVYSQVILADEATLTFDNEVCYKNYENIIFLENGDSVSVLVYDSTTIRKISWNNSDFLEDYETETIKTFDKDDKVTFIGVDGKYLVYQLDKYVYKIKFEKETPDEELYEIKLSTTKFDAANGNMAAEILEGYVYGFYTDSNNKTTYLYRINLKTPAELGEVDKEVGEAEFIGVKE